MQNSSYNDPDAFRASVLPDPPVNETELLKAIFISHSQLADTPVGLGETFCLRQPARIGILLLT